MSRVLTAASSKLRRRPVRGLTVPGAGSQGSASGFAALRPDKPLHPGLRAAVPPGRRKSARTLRDDAGTSPNSCGRRSEPCGRLSEARANPPPSLTNPPLSLGNPPLSLANRPLTLRNGQNWCELGGLSNTALAATNVADRCYMPSLQPEVAHHTPPRLHWLHGSPQPGLMEKWAWFRFRPAKVTCSLLSIVA